MLVWQLSGDASQGGWEDLLRVVGHAWVLGPRPRKRVQGDVPQGSDLRRVGATSQRLRTGDAIRLLCPRESNRRYNSCPQGLQTDGYFGLRNPGGE